MRAKRERNYKKHGSRQIYTCTYMYMEDKVSEGGRVHVHDNNSCLSLNDGSNQVNKNDNTIYSKERKYPCTRGFRHAGSLRLD